MSFLWWGSKQIHHVVFILFEFYNHSSSPNSYFRTINRFFLSLLIKIHTTHVDDIVSTNIPTIPIEIINPDTLTVDLAHKRGWLPIIEHSGVAAGQTAPIAIRLTQIEEERPIESEQKEQEEEEILRGRSAHDGTYGTRQSDNASSSPASPSSSSVSSSSSASTSTTRILGVCMHRLIGDEVSLGVFLRAWAKECESKEHMTDKNCVNEETGGVSGFLHNRWQDSEMSDFFPPVVSFGENRPFLVSYDRTNAMHTIGKDDGRLMQVYTLTQSEFRMHA